MDTYSVSTSHDNLKAGDRFTNQATLANLPAGKWVGVEVVMISGSRYKFRVIEETLGMTTFAGPVSDWVSLPESKSIIMRAAGNPFPQIN